MHVLTKPTPTGVQAVCCTFHRQVAVACPVHLDAACQLLGLSVDCGLQLLWGGSHSVCSILVDDGVASLGNGTNAKPASMHGDL